MACCQRSAPPQDRAPAPAKPLDDSHVWGLATSVAAVLDPAMSNGLLRWSSISSPHSVAFDSLLALGVRFNA